MVNQGVAGTTVDQAAAAAWSEHIRGAVGKFLKTAVVIDNQPSVRTPGKQPATAGLETPTDSGLGEEPLHQLEAPTMGAGPEDHLHNLDLRAVSDAFVSQGVACAFVLPDDEDTETNPDEKKERAVAAAKISDLVVIDWYLADKSESLTLQILKRIAESDTAENGRLRLICVYTGEPLKDAILEDIIKSLKEGGITVETDREKGYYAAGENTIVAVYNKSTTPAKELPGEIISLFSRFADGLIPAFSLAAVGAIRNNAHHMLTRFGKFLDSAYIANRIITNPPSDVSEMMRDLFVAECDSAIGLESVADKYLEANPISKWLKYNEEKITPQQRGNVTVNHSILQQILKNGIKDDKSFNGDNEEIRIPIRFRHLISTALAGSAEKSKLAEHEFARIVALKREAYGRSKLVGTQEWRPSLTTGTLLKYNHQDTNMETTVEYLICLTPACDTLRLNNDTPFVFLRAKIDSTNYGLVLREKDDQETFLRIDPKRPFLRTFSFSPEATPQRVIATPSESAHPEFKFVDCEGREFIWLGEIRHARAANEMAGLLQNWMRIGISDSEYLRMTEEKRFEF